MSSAISRSGHIPESDRQRFMHIPFDVPDGARQLQFTVRYNDQISGDPSVTGGNVLDIGVFDANGIDTGGHGFRGWSGSDQLAFVIGETWSTPPYRAGSLQPGTWHLLLSAYKVAPDGLDWEVGIDIDPDPAVEPGSTTPDPKPVVIERAAALPGWYRGDLHAHTIYSDGDATPRQLAELARARGLDFFGITDHNRSQDSAGLVPTGARWPLLVPGVEVTTYAGHFNVWGTDAWYEFREPSQAGLQGAVD
ncbi:MAG: PHP domain-containing protein, partial [Thermomicrobiales bacterium]